jgi:hypothetical protein
MDPGDLELFRRSLRQATNDYTGAALDDALGEIGWGDAVAIEPRAAIATLFEFQGESNATSSALGHVVRHALGLTTEVDVVLPAIGRWDPPGAANGHSLQVTGLLSGAQQDLESVVTVVRAERGDIAVVVPAASLTLERVCGIDPTLGLLRVTGRDIRSFTDLGPTASEWTSAVAMGRVAVGHELVGASRKMLELAREHALSRVQFGRPISSFQAIRHRLAETLVAIEMAEAMLDAAWLDGTPESAAMAKAVAGRQARTTARHCQQVLAGIGFTTEHPLHCYIQRALALDGLFGTSATLTRDLGQRMIRLTQLPPVLPL